MCTGQWTIKGAAIIRGQYSNIEIYFGEQSDFSMWIQVTEYYIIQETRLIFILPRVKVLTICVSAASNAELPKPNKTSNWLSLSDSSEYIGLYCFTQYWLPEASRYWVHWKICLPIIYHCLHVTRVTKGEINKKIGNKLRYHFIISQLSPLGSYNWVMLKVLIHYLRVIFLPRERWSKHTYLGQI